MKPKMRLRCDRCEKEFSLAQGERTVVSCPSCSCLLVVKECQIQKVVETTYKVSRPSPKEIILEPVLHSAKFRCLECAKIFVWEHDYRDATEKYTKPHCSLCSSPKVVALTPVVAALTQGQVSPKRLKLIRFVRRNFKVLQEIKAHLGGVPELLTRAALPEKIEKRFLRRIVSLTKDLLGTVESHANDRLRERIQEMGVEDGEDLI